MTSSITAKSAKAEITAARHSGEESFRLGWLINRMKFSDLFPSSSEAKALFRKSPASTDSRSPSPQDSAQFGPIEISEPNNKQDKIPIIRTFLWWSWTVSPNL